MTYFVNEVFASIQGEGTHTGRRAVFCRFSGCNLWNGHEEGRRFAACQFCDTDFVNWKRYDTAVELAAVIEEQWGPGRDHRFVVLTGGEPSLQVDEGLCVELKRLGFYVAIETNGTKVLPRGWVDWITVSPKAGTKVVAVPDEMKVVWPQDGLDLSEPWIASHKNKRLQPRSDVEGSGVVCLDEINKDPSWVLSFQVHKALGLR